MFQGCLLLVLPVPDTLVSLVQLPYPYPTLGTFGTPAVKYPGTGYGPVEVPGVGYGYGYKQPYNTRPFGKLGKTSRPVPDSLVSSVRHPYPYPILW